MVKRMTPEEQDHLLLDIHAKVSTLPVYVEQQKAHELRLGFVENRVAQIDTTLEAVEKDHDELGQSIRGHAKDRSLHSHPADSPVLIESRLSKDAKIAAKILDWGLEHPTAALFLAGLLFTALGVMLNKFIVFMHNVPTLPVPHIPFNEVGT